MENIIKKLKNKEENSCKLSEERETKKEFKNYNTRLELNKLKKWKGN